MAMGQRRSRRLLGRPLTRRQGLQSQALLPWGRSRPYMALLTLSDQTSVDGGGWAGPGRCAFSSAQRFTSGIQRRIRYVESGAK